MIGKPLVLMESCDVSKICFQIIAKSMPYFENDFQLCIEIPVSGIVGICGPFY
jgi:hypothetical protein